MPTEAQIDKLLQERYYLSTESSWEQVAKRLSKLYPPIHNYILNKEFIPSSPTIMNANTKGERMGTLSSCFIMEITDSMDNIMEAMKESAQVTRMGGGVGYDFSGLRASTEIVSSTSKESGGPLGFIGILNAVLDGVMQGGARRGAGLAQLSVYHPDILRFINAKKDITKYNRINFSVRIDDDFYIQLEKTPNKMFKTKNIVDKKEIELKDDDGKLYTYKDLWDCIIESAWLSAEPGIINSGIMVSQNTCTNISDKVGNNPCSELSHLPYVSCNLGSIDLSKFVINGKFDTNAFENMISESVIFLDKILDENEYPIDKIKEMTLSVRPIGLGFMGLAHALYKMEIPYNSQDGLDFVKYVTKSITFTGTKVSIDLAKKFGSYDYFDFNTFKDATKRWESESEWSDIINDVEKYGIRNSVMNSYAPTGSISYIANTSSGIEPVFALAYTRKIEKTNGKYEEVFITDHVFDEFLNKNYKKQKNDILKSVVKNEGSCQKCSILSEKDKNIFMTASDLTPMEHLDSLAIASKFVYTSISKTINLPEEISKEKVSEVYLEAWKKGVIGVTVYRKNSRNGILTTSKEKDVTSISTDRLAPKRPTIIDCDVNIATVNKKQYYVIVGIENNEPYEIFTGENYNSNGEIFIPKRIKDGKLKKKNKGEYILIHGEEEFPVGGSHSIPEVEALSRQISLNLRHFIPLQFVVEQLQKGNYLTAFHKVIARTLKKYIKNNTESTEKCPNCGGTLVYISGCVDCRDCGRSLCS